MSMLPHQIDIYVCTKPFIGFFWIQMAGWLKDYVFHPASIDCYIIY